MMKSRSSLQKDTHAAATELGYIFTFLLGVLLMSMFSVWAWGIETSTRERWNDEDHPFIDPCVFISWILRQLLNGLQVPRARAAAWYGEIYLKD